MGDLNAPCYGQGSHVGVLSTSSVAYPREARALRGQPFPVAAHAELLTLDDRVGIAARPRGSQVVPPSLEESFRAGPAVLANSGLKVHEDKSVRNSAHFLALGMEVRGAIPETGADRLRRFALA